MIEKLIGLVCLLSAVWVIYQALTSKMKTAHRIFWIIAAMLFSILTAIVYFITKKR